MKAKVFYGGKQVWEGEVEGGPSLAEKGTAELEALFAQFNIGNHGGLRIRSMSVGDEVELEGLGRFVCAPIGWEKID